MGNKLVDEEFITNRLCDNITDATFNHKYSCDTKIISDISDNILDNIKKEFEKAGYRIEYKKEYCNGVSVILIKVNWKPV